LQAWLTPVRDESNAGALPAAGPRRQVGHGAVVFTVGPSGNHAAAKMKIGMPKIAARPAATRGERDDLFDDGGGRAWANEGGCLGAPPRRGGLFRRRRGGRRSGRYRFGAAVGPGRDGDGDFFDLGDCHRPCGQQAKHDADAAGGAAGAAFPAPDGPWTDAEPPGDAALREAEHVERREAGRG